MRCAAALLLASSALAGCPGPTTPEEDAPMSEVDTGVDTGLDAGAPDAGTETTTAIDPALGGFAIAADGNFVLYVPPGALSAPTDIRIRTLVGAARPAEASAALGGVYEVTPEGLTFAVPAFAATRVPAPEGFTNADGTLLLAHHALSADGTEEQPPTTTSLDPDDTASALTLAPLTHLSVHWGEIGDGNRIGITMPEGPFAVGQTFTGNAVVSPVFDRTVELVAIQSIAPLSDRAGVVNVATTGILYPPTATELFEASRVGLNSAVVVRDGAFRLVSATPAPIPAPGWRCEHPAPPTDIFFSVSIDGQSFEARSEVECRPGGEVLVGDVRTLRATAAGPVFTPTTSFAANVVAPDAATKRAEQSFGTWGEGPLTFGAGPRTSVPGPDTVRFGVPGASLLGTRMANRYDVLLDGAFAVTSAPMPITGTFASAPDQTYSVTPTAPIGAPADFLTVDGLRTTLSWPVGQCDAFVVRAVLSGPTPGEIFGRIACADGVVSGGRTSVRMLEDETLAQIEALGASITQITVGVVGEVDCSDLFVGDARVPCLVGHFVQMSPSALEPFVPGPCGDPVSFAGNIEIRWSEAEMTCDVIRTGDSGATGIDVGRIDTRSGGSVWRYTITSTSHGTISGMRIDGLPFGTDVTVVLAEPSGTTLTITFRIDGDTLSVSRFEAS